jgi:hypothetical protein
MPPIIPLPQLPPFRQESPELIRVLDRIRFELDSDDNFAEFCWFAREYPRIYRYHLDHAELRLRDIHSRYVKARQYFAHQLEQASDNIFEISIGNQQSYEVYWDFEAYLSATNTALDILARVIGTGYAEQTPPSFNRLCSKAHLSGYVDILRDAKRRWVSRLKDYRDCFVHYTPVDTMTFLVCRLYPDGWEVRCKLPVNPNVRDILGFRFSRRAELLKYSLTVYRHMRALNKKIAKAISRAYASGEYPKRINHLFFVGSRRT